jgi:hypothetical protein
LPPRPRSLPHDLIGLVDLEAGELQMAERTAGEHLAGLAGRVLLQRERKSSRAASAKPFSGSIVAPLFISSFSSRTVFVNRHTHDVLGARDGFAASTTCASC